MGVHSIGTTLLDVSSICLGSRKMDLSLTLCFISETVLLKYLNWRTCPRSNPDFYIVSKMYANLLISVHMLCSIEATTSS